MRLFIAIELSRPVRYTLMQIIRHLRMQGLRASYTREENLHLTLAFLGEIGAPAAAIRAMRNAVRLHPRKFSLTLSGYGNFGELLWIGLEKNPLLMSLAAALQDALRNEGFSLENRPFLPHITIARRAAFIPKIEAFPHSHMTVHAITLMQSRQKDGRQEYQPLYHEKLK